MDKLWPIYTVQGDHRNMMDGLQKYLDERSQTQKLHSAFELYLNYTVHKTGEANLQLGTTVFKEDVFRR